jgi:hypothetical protein
LTRIEQFTVPAGGRAVAQEWDLSRRFPGLPVGYRRAAINAAV